MEQNPSNIFIKSAISGRIPSRSVAAVQVFRHDTRVIRKVVNRQSRSASSAGGATSQGAKRGNITSRSDKSRNRLLFALRNMQGAKLYATLTYGEEYPQDGATVKKHLAALRKWLAGRGIGGIWLLEFQERDAVHVHLVLNGLVSEEELGAKWAAIIRTNWACVSADAIYNELPLASYLCKHKQSEIPEGFSKLGRTWATFGGVKIEPLETIMGDRADIAPAVRFLKNLERARRRSAKRRSGRKQPRRFDHGVCGFTSRDTSLPMLQYLDKSSLNICHNRNTSKIRQEDSGVESEHKTG